MKNKLLLATLVTCLSVNAYAIPVSQPNHCPSVTALQTAPLTLGQLDFKTNTYSTAAFNNAYDTNATWTFVIGNVKAADATDAIKKATADISRFTARSPQPEAFMNGWICGYASDMGYQVLAVSPSIAQKTLASLTATH